MAMTAAQIHSARGTKHTCGNDECGKRFYDLNRSPLDCPYCGVTLDLEAAAAPRHEFVMEPGKKARSKYYKLTGPAAEEAEEAPAQDADSDSDSDDTTDDADTQNILIEDDESDPTTDDVIEKPHSNDEA
jgi:uncharacterized protein (TIGR02300 family)